MNKSKRQKMKWINAKRRLTGQAFINEHFSRPTNYKQYQGSRLQKQDKQRVHP